jgi:hypothetical protein
MSKQKQLKIYKKALLHYQISSIFIIGFIFKALLLDADISRGFCLYFNDYYLQNNLPILYSLKPTNTYCNSEYWFKPGKLAPRIECLKKAIKLCKE